MNRFGCCLLQRLRYLFLIVIIIAVTSSNVSAIEKPEQGVALLSSLCPNSKVWFASSVAKPEYRNAASGWSIYAQEDVPEGAVILEVPLKETIYLKQNACGRSRELCDAVEYLRSELEAVSGDADEVTLALLLLAESKWNRYAGSVMMIAEASRIAVSDDVRTRVLQPLVPELAYRYETIEYLLKRVRSIVQERFSSVEELKFMRENDKLDVALFAVTSRSFFLPIGTRREVVMVPCGDLFNHEESDQAVRYSVENDDTLVFRTRRKYNKGEEMRINYGDKSSEDLLFQYGFFLPESNRTIVRVPLTKVAGEALKHPVKQVLLKTFAPKGKIKLSREGLVGMSLGLLRALMLSGPELSSFELANVLGRHRPGPSAESETSAALLLEEAVYRELLKFKNVFDENEAIIQIMPHALNEMLITNLRILAAAWRRTAEQGD